MSGAPARGIAPRRQRRHHHHHHHHHHQKHQKHSREEPPEEPEEKRPKVNPIFLWASQREQRIVEVRCEDYDKRNRIKLTKTAQGWRSIPRTASNMYPTLGIPQERKSTSSTSSTSSSVSNDEKENGKEKQSAQVTVGSLQQVPMKERPNGRTNGLVVKEKSGKKRSYDEVRNDENRGDYSFPLENVRNGTRVGASWEEHCGRVPCSDGDEDKEEEELTEEDRRFGKGPKNREQTNLERLQKDKLFQPRVVLEQLHLSQIPESAYQSIHRTREKKDGKKEGKDAEEDGSEKKKSEDKEKRCRLNKAGIQDILNMIDATASPVLATDTPSADLPSPLDSTKTYELVNETAQKKSSDRTVKETNFTVTGLSSKVKDRLRKDSFPTNANESVNGVANGVTSGDNLHSYDKLEVHEEEVLESRELEEEKANDEERIISFKSSTGTIVKTCKIAEADGGMVNQTKCKVSPTFQWRNSIPTNDPTLDTEEEAPDDPGEPIKIDYGDSSKILNALRNTPGLSVSITKAYIQDSKSIATPSTRPSSKASSSSRSPDSQAECVEKFFKSSVVDYVPGGNLGEARGHTSSPRNLPGLSIIIPNYRYRNTSNQVVRIHSNSPNTKHRVESPESTVNFPKMEAYVNDSKLDRFSHEEDDEERDIEEEDEDDCDSQVLEDLRRQKADSLVYGSMDSGYFHRPNSSVNQDDRKTPLESTRTQDGATSHWLNSSKSSEAQAKCKYQDLEHFDEQVLEELRSRGTVVSPQPSGIPCSPASRRPSSAYLERLLPSPPCSVSCSEDAKSDLTLKAILSSPSRLESKDCERPREPTNRCDQGPNDHLMLCPDYSKDAERSNHRRNNRALLERLNVSNQDVRNPGRPMSSGDIHSTIFPSDRATQKRPMSAEWSARHKNHYSSYQKSGRPRVHSIEQEVCATSTSSSDKLLDPASQLRELIETSGHLIPDPLLVPRDYLPGLAAAPAKEIPKLLASRPELRLPEALTRPDLLRDPDLLVISLAHLQHVLDHGEGPVSRSRQAHPRINNGTNKGSGHASNGTRSSNSQTRPKLSCKPIGTLMPAPIDLSSGRRPSPYPPLLRVRSGLLKQEPEVSSTASSPDDSQLWHPLFGSQKRQQQQPQQPKLQQQQQQQQPQQQQHQHQHQQHTSWHRTTLAS